MSDSERTLELVFDENGDDPLVLECAWNGLPGREAPNLKRVRAKVTLRALAILLVLAKHRQYSTEANQPMEFRVKSPEFGKGTWICTIANDLQETLQWVKTHFHIQDAELFFFGCVGSTHNVGGKQTPSVEFYPKKLPLTNLLISVKNSRSLNAKPRPLRHDELLGYALKLEAKHWKKSAIRELFCGKSASIEITPSRDALYSAYMANAEIVSQNGNGLDIRNHFDLVFRVLMEKEFNSYRENSQPFFSYIGNSIGSAKLPFLWKGRTWNRDQLQFLRDNCGVYALNAYFHTDTFINSADAYSKEFQSSIWSTVSFRQDIPDTPFHIFKILLEPEKYGPQADLMKRVIARNQHSSAEWYENSKWLLENELGSCVELIKEVLVHKNRSIAIGAFFAQQVLWIDFLAEVCLPFYLPSCVGDWRPLKSLNDNIFYLRQEASDNRDLVRKFCRTGRDFMNAMDAGRRLLQAQAAFYSAMHRKLMALEG